MKTSKDILLQLVRMSLWGPEKETVSIRPDWNKVLPLAMQQTLIGLVANAIPHLHEEFRPAPQTFQRLHTKAANIFMGHSLLNGRLAELKNRLDEAGIHSVLFKGQGVALNYPNPLLRQCGDIDMYVGKKHFEAALKLLKPNSDKKASDYKNLKHFNLIIGGVDIEIHRIAETLPGLRRNRMFQEWTKEHLEGPELDVVEIGGASINLPPHQFNALYIMNHAWHHFMTGGIGLRQLCDWSMFLHRHHKDIDHITLMNDLKRFGLFRAWQILGGVAVEHLGLPAEECPLYNGKYISKSHRVMEVIWDEGNFGFHSSDRKKKRPDGHFAGKWHSFVTNSRRIYRIFSISPLDILNSWIHYFIIGMSNVFVRIK